jgi:hypothetical protein
MFSRDYHAYWLIVVTNLVIFGHMVVHSDISIKQGCLKLSLHCSKKKLSLQKLPAAVLFRKQWELLPHLKIIGMQKH